MELTEQDLTLFTPYNITSADTDMESRLRLGGVVNLLIQSAISSADNLGFGFSGLRELQLFWVLRNLTVELYRPIGWSEVVTVETWPKDIDGVLYLRDFVVRDANQEVVAKATSGWLALDLSTKRPKRFNNEQMLYFTKLKDKNSLTYLPEKLSAAKCDMVEVAAIKPTFYDIDLNRHVTSTRYIDWMIDSLPTQFLLEAYPAKLTINYLKETMLGDTVSIRSGSTDDATFLFEGYNQTQQTTAFRGLIEFRKQNSTK